jgi:hypothetical protein
VIGLQRPHDRPGDAGEHSPDSGISFGSLPSEGIRPAPFDSAPKRPSHNIVGGQKSICRAWSDFCPPTSLPADEYVTPTSAHELLHRDYRR